jgi:DNA polymerase/3'-5' exonuclease PolX
MDNDSLGWLQEIYGIGEVGSMKILTLLRNHYKLKWTSKAGLYRILKRPEIFDMLPESAKVYLKYMPDRVIPYEIMQKFDADIHCARMPRFVIAGSYIRKKPFSRDVDIVMMCNDPDNRIATFDRFIRTLQSSNKVSVLTVFASGNSRVSVMFKYNASTRPYIVKADVFLTTKDEWIFAMLYAIGSGDFNIRMRAVAKRKGYRLNQTGIYKDGVRVDNLTKEQQIFDLLGIEYLTPEQRTLPAGTIKK